MANMTPGDYDFPTHYAGDGLRAFNITLQEDDETPIDLTGAEIRMQLRTDKTNTSNNVAYEFATAGIEADSLITVPSPATGVITLAEILSWTLPAATYYYDLQVKDSTGFIQTYLKGRWTVNQDITK